MRKPHLYMTLTSAILFLFVAMTGAAAQSALLDLPRASQRAVVTQRLGITNITLRYHRPLTKGRKVFGKIVVAF